jgi:hypothetical protein
MRLIARKDKNHSEILQKYDIFFCRGPGYRRTLICSAYKSYISAHPYHSYHDIVINSDIELHYQDQTLIVSVYYHETDSSDKIINQNTEYYKSTDNGSSWMKLDAENDPVQLSSHTLICSLHL